ncbi:MAG: hypothetical protein JWL84_2005 [Rhodospirillales bacterium]|jgi:hypothetical protein|nr:hypothetical protein [Rhodospirillales bacterium]
MRRLLSVALLGFALAAGVSRVANAAPECKTGKLCGDTCIAKDKMCHLSKPAKECNTGKLCGNSCISKDKICNK